MFTIVNIDGGVCFRELKGAESFNLMKEDRPRFFFENSGLFHQQVGTITRYD